MKKSISYIKNINFKSFKSFKSFSFSFLSCLLFSSVSLNGMVYANENLNLLSKKTQSAISSNLNVNFVKEAKSILNDFAKTFNLEKPEDLQNFQQIQTIIGNGNKPTKRHNPLPFLPPEYDFKPYKNTYCFKEAAEHYQLDEKLLRAIYKLEYGNYKNQLSQANKSKNYGILQINDIWLSHFKKHNLKINDLLDPCLSLHLGSYILDNNRKRNKEEWKYVGGFISNNEKEQKEYYQKVMKIYKNL